MERQITKKLIWKYTKKIIYFLLPGLSVLILFFAWDMGSRVTTSLPRPMDVYERFVKLLGRPISNATVWEHILVSLGRVGKAISLSTLCGVLFGLFLGWNRIFKELFKPLFELIRPIPPIAWIPLISVWFGVGEPSKIIIIFIGTLMPIVVNTYTGVTMIPPLTLDAAKSLGATRFQILYDIVFPSSLQAIFAGIRSAFSSGWMVVLGAEMISSRSGLGFLIIRGSDSNDLALSMVAMVFIGLIGAIIAYGFDYVERGVCPWLRKLN